MSPEPRSPDRNLPQPAPPIGMSSKSTGPAVERSQKSLSACKAAYSLVKRDVGPMV
jgi:hypothetical protein